MILNLTPTRESNGELVLSGDIQLTREDEQFFVRETQKSFPILIDLHTVMNNQVNLLVGPVPLLGQVRVKAAVRLDEDGH